MLITRLRLSLLPVVDGLTGDADEHGVVGGGQANLLAVSLQAAGREPSALDVRFDSLRGPLSLLQLEVPNLLGEGMRLALQISDVPAILGVRLSYRFGLRLHFLAGEPGDLLFEYGCDTGHVDPFLGLRVLVKGIVRVSSLTREAGPATPHPRGECRPSSSEG